MCNRSAPAGSQTVVDDRVASSTLKVLLWGRDQYVYNPSCCGRTCKHRGEFHYAALLSARATVPSFCHIGRCCLLAALCAVVLPFHLDVESKQQQPEANTLLYQQHHAQCLRVNSSASSATSSLTLVRCPPALFSLFWASSLCFSTALHSFTFFLSVAGFIFLLSWPWYWQAAIGAHAYIGKTFNQWLVHVIKSIKLIN